MAAHHRSARRRRAFALTALSAAAVALVVPVAAGTASAAATPAVRLRSGDAVDVLGTRIACFAVTSSGKDGIYCVLWDGKKPLVGSFGAGLAVDGTAVLNRITRDGTTQPIARRPEQHAAGRVYRLKAGDAFGFPLPARVNLGCKILDITDRRLRPIYRGVKVSCWRARKDPLPRTYGVTVSDRVAGIFRFDAHGRVSPAGAVTRPQPR